MMNLNMQVNIRTMRDENGEFWFVAKDVCTALDIFWSGKKTLASISDKWKLVVKLPTSFGDKQTIFINEAALYKLAFRSNKPETQAHAPASFPAFFVSRSTLRLSLFTRSIRRYDSLSAPFAYWLVG
jgi:hypothetical protein